MEHKRIKIRATNNGNKHQDLYVYADQLNFFSKYPEEDKTNENLKDFTLRWMIYNAIDDKCDDDPTCNLIWDHETDEAYFVFDQNGKVAFHLRELELL